MRAPRSSANLSLIGLVLLGLLAAVLSTAALLSNRSLPAEPAAPSPRPSTLSSTSSPAEPAPSASPSSPTAQATSATPAVTGQPPVAGVGTVVIIGDSNSVGAPSDTWVGTAAEALGWTEVVNLSSPGRGYVTAPRSCDFEPCDHFAGSIPAILDADPDVVVTFGGTADGDYGLAEAASSYYAALRAELPGAQLVAIAPVTTAETADFWLAMHAQTISAGVAAVDGTFIDPGQPGVGDGDELSPEANAQIAQAVIAELS